MRRLVAAAMLLGCATAWAHGGLPVSQKILRVNGGDTMYVPVVYWGVWVGKPGGPWTWICEELINTYRFRHFALSTDGVFYTTNQSGLTLSTDKGCTWTDASGPLAALHTTDVEADPVDGMTAYVASGDSGTVTADGGIIPAQNGVFVTHDHGATWNALPGLAADSARLFQSVRVAAVSTSTIYVSSANARPPFTIALHRSIDGGQNFSRTQLSYQLDGNDPHLFEIMAIDPRNADVLYARAVADVPVDMDSLLRHAMLRSIDGGMTWTELFTVDGVTEPSGQTRGIDGVAIDAVTGNVWFATRLGLRRGVDTVGGAASFNAQPVGTLQQTQCVDVHGGNLFACASQFVDHAAVAESTDVAKSFMSVMNYVDTRGPVSCPATTPVGAQCPAYWYMYGSQLGIGFDAGAPDMTGTAPHKSSGCSVGGVSSAFGGVLFAMVVLMLAARTAIRTGASSAGRGRRRG